MSNTLDRRPLESLDGLTVGRQVKLGTEMPDARTRTMTATFDTVGFLIRQGYQGAIEQVLTCDARFPVTIPEGTRGLVADLSGTFATVVFVWRTPKSNKTTAAAVHVYAAELVNHRGAPPLPGEPAPANRSTSTTSTTPAKEPAPMLATLTATPSPIATNPTPAPAAPAAGSLDAILTAVIDARVGARIEALENELATRKAAPSVIHVKVNNGAPVTLSKRPHARFPFVLARASMRKPDGGRFNLFLTGDAGTGKSTVASSVAEALGLPFHSLNCSGGLTEGALVGRMTPNLTNGEMTYTPGPLVKSFRDGGVFLLDELDAADENVLLALNTLADANVWHAPNGETIHRNPDHILMAAGNTFGTGASRIFSGRNQLDGAFLNRWLTVTVDYDTDLETSLCATREIAERIQSARVQIRARNLRRWLTTRDILKADALVGQVGLTVREALNEITTGWTAEDRAAVGIA